MRPVFIFGLFSLAIINACNTKTEPAEEHFELEQMKTENSEVREVIYSMVLPTDLSNLFNRSGTNYDPSVPASVRDFSLYNNLEQIAIMLGIYGVDLTYTKLMEQNLAAAQYYNTIKTLSEKAGIPGTIFEKSAGQLERYFNNEDSLAAVIDNIFRETDRHFRQNGQENLAALSLAGGWIEAMYIGTRIFEADSGNQAMAEMLLQQKYSLNSIYTILSNHQESLTVKEFLLMLKKLRKVFNDVEIRYQKEGFNVDTSSRKIQTNSTQMRYNENTIPLLLTTVPLIRDNLVAPRNQDLN